ncbi:NAD-dependent DNA ligase LigA [Buchnera aphidicola]|uniref:NAD-dependent DNA ligase LigA n=1 Tax=Buchnera aphidicola TaxID=9 RepID=UPI002542CB5D|nr:NAD-dependent DNA ligase LigA [Buchnera aphidicola]WII23729.1 NAD-dependent DNA ligase LigA [Buchnera aphidicola (Sipha maydis)]
MNKIKREIRFLQQTLIYHNYLYFCLDNPIISDHEYDFLFNKLKSLEKKYKERKSNSPTQIVGSKIFSNLLLNRHLTPMLSLENIFKKNEFFTFHKKILKYKKKDQLIDFTCELKLDGVAVNLIYENGILKKASTRGDGVKGEDITKNIFLIKSIPKKINTKIIPKLMEIRGEVLISKKDFKNLNKKNIFLKKNVFSSARNLASGSLRQKNLKNFVNRKLVFFCHGFEMFNFFLHNSYYDILCKIKKWGFSISPEIFFSSSYEKILKFYSKVQNKRSLLEFDVDGIVIKVNDLRLRKKIGMRSRSPRWAIAYKFPNQEKKTILKKVTFHVGRTGIVTPVAHFIPIYISGIKIEKATLYNKNFLESLNLHIGDKIIVCRSGDVIPKIISKEITCFKKENVQVIFPKKCPSCKNLLKNLNNRKTVCKNYFFCKSQIKKRLIYFFSKKSFEIQDLGPNIINQLVDKLNFKNPIDFFQLDIKTLNDLNNVGEKTATSIVKSIKKIQSISLEKFILSFGILGIGEIASKKIAKHFKSINNVLNSRKKDLIKINGIGEITAKNFLRFINSYHNKMIIKKLMKNCQINIFFSQKNFHKEKKSSFFLDKQVLITGVLKNFTRKNLFKILENLGATLQYSFSKKVNLVIRGQNPGKKLDYAKNSGVKIINENDLLKKIPKNFLGRAGFEPATN